jgi:DNA (cytosine-5)-methyltransferase 1
MNRSDEDQRLKAVSLFSGLGGIDIGLHQAGIETVACVEKDETAAETLKINSRQHSEKPDQDQISVPEKYPWKVIDTDIREVDAEDILEECDAAKDDIDLVVGGPPCQTFSRSNEGSRSGTDTKRGKLYREYAKILHQIEPQAFIFENVRGLKSANDGKDLKMVREELERDTYDTEAKVLNAANFGVPQTRKRIIIVGTKPGTEFEFPEPSHTEDGEEGTEEWVSAGEALSEFNIDQDMEQEGGYTNAIGSKYGPLLKDIPQGANYQHFSERKYDTEQEEYVERSDDELDVKEFGWRTRHWNYLLKMDQGRPSWTLQAAPGTTVGPFHWRARKLSLLEQMKLMTLPLNYYIAGSPSQIQKQIGNAVPPKFAEAVANKLVDSLDIPTAPFEDVSLEHREEGSESEDQFPVEVDTEESPWICANRILNTVLSENVAAITAKQQAIPFAIDALEIARRQAQVDLDFEIEEKTVEGENEKGGVSSKLEVKAASEKAKIKLTA